MSVVRFGFVWHLTHLSIDSRGHPGRLSSDSLMLWSVLIIVRPGALF